MADDGFYDDAAKLAQPEADRLVVRYALAKGAQCNRATSVAVLRWADYPNDHHNRRRVHDALRRYCDPTGETSNGRHVFTLPARGDLDARTP